MTIDEIMAERKKTPDVPVTWDDLGQLASALSMLTQANLSEGVLGEIAAVLIRRIGTFGEELLAEAGQPAQERTEVVMVDLAPKSAAERVRDIQREIEAQAQTPWEPGGGTIVASVKLTAKIRMEWTRKGLEEVMEHVTAMETMVPAESRQLAVLGKPPTSEK